MDVKNKKYKNLRTGEIETAYEIGYAFAMQCFKESEPGNETMNPKESDKEDVILVGISVVEEDHDYMEV